MQKDSIETLLSRHYGDVAPVPGKLQEQLLASLRQENTVLNEQQQISESLQYRRFSRRRAVKLVALGTAGLGAVSLGMEGLRVLESALTGQDINSRTAYP